ncbi:hypothetical protein JG688_00013713 [Phytophthora aleatoria]|uniref:Uncharacterized protein n=1 Tax=Phytophthora aleatoria TaxID=2496075 RepID=A0A8J5III8_9STRA|nr:hypothetical protein JG688_00013713 [Phytophthora aleatoria]
MATNRDLCAFFFEHQGEGVLHCKISDADRQQLPGTGYSNLVSHLSSRHEDFRAQYDAHNRGTQRPFKILDSEVDSELTRSMSKWRSANSKAVKADMVAVATKLGVVITENMVIVFGDMYTGWTHGTVHFVAVYGLFGLAASFDESSLPCLPRMKEIKMLMPTSLAFGTTNHCIVNKIDIRLQANNLMLQLCQPNNAAELSKLTLLRAKKRNVTRWSSTYEMLQLYGTIRPQIRLVEAVEDLVPSTSDYKKLVGLSKHLKKLDSVCKRLSCETTTMNEICDGDMLSAAEIAALKRLETPRSDEQPAATGRKRKERQDSYAAKIIQQGGFKRRQVERAAYSPMLMLHRASKDMWDVTSLI